MHLPLIKFPVNHIDRCYTCCEASWLAISGMPSNAIARNIQPGKKPTLLGYIPTPYHAEFCGLAIVYECPECHTKWWTHYDWVRIDRNLLSPAALECLENIID